MLFYVTALGLKVSDFGSDVFFLFFDLTLLFLCYSASCKGVGFRFRCILCLRVSGLGSDVFFWFFHLRLLFYVTALGLRVFGLCSDVLFWFFDVMLLFVRYCGWFKGVGFRC